MTRIMMQKPAYKHIPRAHNHMQRQQCMHRHVATNIMKNEQGYEIHLAVPGIDKSNIDMYVKDDLLYIGMKETDETAQKDFKLKQFDYSNFKKRFELSDDLDRESIAAKYENGILKIAIQLKDQSETVLTKKIDIK